MMEKITSIIRRKIIFRMVVLLAVLPAMLTAIGD